MTEVDLMAAIKRLSVNDESKLAHRIKLCRTIQPPGTSVRTFYAQLEG